MLLYPDALVVEVSSRCPEGGLVARLQGARHLHALQRHGKQNI